MARNKPKKSAPYDPSFLWDSTQKKLGDVQERLINSLMSLCEDQARLIELYEERMKLTLVQTDSTPPAETPAES